MSEPYLGEIRLFPWNWAPHGWRICDGSLLAIQANAALFSLLGTQYGGNGTQSFALPDMRGRAPIHFGSQHPQGALDGVESVTLTLGQLPNHSHKLSGSSQAGLAPAPSGTLSKVDPATSLHYAPDTAVQALNPLSVQQTGNSAAHENMQPYLVLNYCIAIQGVFPARN